MAARTSGMGSHRWRRWAVALAVVGIAGSGALSPVAAGAAEPSADLSVGVVHAPATATAPADITFTVTATNAGPDTAEAVVAGLGYQYPLELRTVPPGCRRSASYESVVCELGDIASGSSASVQVVLQARGSGLFSLPAVVASDTPDPDTADLAATDTLLVKAGPSQAVRYIKGIFPMILNRVPNTATTDYWAARWKAENNRYPRKLERVPAGIINSDEYRRIRIREIFTKTLERLPDPSGLAYWVGKARTGTSYDTIVQKMVGSTEFRSLHRDDPLEAIYQAVLGRNPTPVEVVTWVHVVAGSGAERAFIARSLQRSTEGYDVVINRFYQATFGTGPNALGRYVWQVRLRDGQSPEALWSQLLVSNEVLQKYPYTVDDYEGGEYEYDVPVSSVQAAIAAG